MIQCPCPCDDVRMCINGSIYGPCGAENCSGVCEPEAVCECQVPDCVRCA